MPQSHRSLGSQEGNGAGMAGPAFSLFVSDPGRSKLPGALGQRSGMQMAAPTSSWEMKSPGQIPVPRRNKSVLNCRDWSRLSRERQLCIKGKQREKSPASRGKKQHLEVSSQAGAPLLPPDPLHAFNAPSPSEGETHLPAACQIAGTGGTPGGQ